LHTINIIFGLGATPSHVAGFKLQVPGDSLRKIGHFLHQRTLEQDLR